MLLSLCAGCNLLFAYFFFHTLSAQPKYAASFPTWCDRPVTMWLLILNMNTDLIEFVSAIQIKFYHPQKRLTDGITLCKSQSRLQDM